MSDTSPEPIDEDVAQLLINWINADTWEQSKEMLEANAEMFLSDEALESLTTLVLEDTGEDEEDRARRAETLQQHKAILEQARAESIDAAYAKLLEPSPFSLALQKMPDELQAAILAMITANSLDELGEQFAQHPVLFTPQATTAIEELMANLRQAGQVSIVQGIEERYTTLKQVKTINSPINDDVARLLVDWINADTWEESKEILRSNAERFLNDEAIETLTRLLLLNASDDDQDHKSKTLQQHLTILKLARDESIDDAYTKLLRPSPLTLTLQKLPDELRSAIQAMIAVNSPGELVEQIRKYPILLTPKATSTIDTLLDELRQANQVDAVQHIDQRYDTLKEVIVSARDPLNELLNALLQAKTPDELQQVIAGYPMLHNIETSNMLTERISQIEQDGNAVVAQGLRFRLDEVRRLQEQENRTTNDSSTHSLDHDDEGDQARLMANRNSIAVGRNEGDITQTNIENYIASLPTKQWQPPKRQSLRKTFVGRQKEMQELRDHLLAGEGVAITDTITATMLQGMGGIGKTFLANKLATELQAHFPGGVIHIELGPLVTNEKRAQVQLRILASFAFGGIQPQLVGQLANSLP